MKTKATVFFGLVVLVLIAVLQLGFKHLPSAANTNIQQASLFDFTSDTDTFDFDKSEFKEEMRKLREEIKKWKCDDMHEYFKGEEFKDQMKNLKDALSKMKFEDFHFDFDQEAFAENMKEMTENLKNQMHNWKDIDVDIDLSGLEESMKELKENMKDLKINMDDLSVEMEKMKGFIKELKSEMKSDGLVEDEDDDVEIDFHKDEMKVNGEKVSDELFRKYKAIYKAHYGKEPDDDTHFRIR